MPRNITIFELNNAVLSRNNWELHCRHCNIKLNKGDKVRSKMGTQRQNYKIWCIKCAKLLHML